MSKLKSLTLLFCFTTASLLSACNPATIFDARPSDLCADIGDGHCPVPPPDDLNP